MHFPTYHVKLDWLALWLRGDHNEALCENASLLRDRYLETTRQVRDERRAHAGIEYQS